MKKILTLFVLLFTIGLVQAQTDTKERPIKTTIKQSDLPLGTTFALVLYDAPIITGKVNERTLCDLPLGVPFILSNRGVVTHYVLTSKKCERNCKH